MIRVISKDNSNLLFGLIILFLLTIIFLFSIFYFSSLQNLKILNSCIFIGLIIYNIFFGSIIFSDQNISFIFFTPLFWYKFISTLFCGLGPLAYYFGTPFTIDYMNSYYFASEITITKISMIYLLSSIITDSLFLLFNKISPISQTSPEKKINKKLLLAFSLGIGLSAKYLIILPSAQIGINTLGIFFSFSPFILIGLFLSYNIGMKNKKYKKLFFAILGLEMFSSFLFLAKEYLFVSVVFASLTIFFHKRNFKNVILTGLISALLYVTIIQNLFLLLRTTGDGNSGITSSQDIVVAIDAVRGLSESTNILAEENYGPLQNWWDRLSYIKYQAYAVDAYDIGMSGDSFNKFKYIFIPRIIFPEKPNLIPGKEYHAMVTQRYNERIPTSVGPGIFVEAYWNGGWTYVVLISIYFSILLFFSTRIIVKQLREKNYTILFFGVNAIYIGRSIDGWFVGQYGGSVVNMIIVYIFFLITYNMLEHIMKINRLNVQ